ncbi:MAG: DUF2752 domain-containing protein [Clostridia bacterium]|nr:DUF2752 domain-containing protein [Clostridia bacterium]
MEQKKRGLLICFFSFVLLALGLLLAFLVTKGFKILCPFSQLTGLLCPGCGNTRATLALLRLDWKEALHFNLLYPLEMLYLFRIYILCSKNFIENGKFRYHTRPDWIDITCLFAILIWTVARNILAI